MDMLSSLHTVNSSITVQSAPRLPAASVLCYDEAILRLLHLGLMLLGWTPCFVDLGGGPGQQCFSCPFWRLCLQLQAW